MPLTIDAIRSAGSDEQLLDLLTSELQRIMPQELEGGEELFNALSRAPIGLRSMAAVHPLDVSMSLDDLAWHFGNYNDRRLLKETHAGLKELGAEEAAEIFLAACEIVEPHLTEIRSTDWNTRDWPDYLESSGIQSKIEPLNGRMWNICKEMGDLGLLQYWIRYARQHAENCVSEV